MTSLEGLDAADTNRVIAAFERARMAYAGPDAYHRLHVVTDSGEVLHVKSVWRDGRDITVTVDQSPRDD